MKLIFTAREIRDATGNAAVLFELPKSETAIRSRRVLAVLGKSSPLLPSYIFYGLLQENISRTRRAGDLLLIPELKEAPTERIVDPFILK